MLQTTVKYPKLKPHANQRFAMTTSKVEHLWCLIFIFFFPQELPLYCSGGLRFFWDNKFDHAMVAFLDCVQQFKEEVEKGETRFCLPYR